MSSHVLFLVVFAALVSAAFAALQRDTPREQLRMALTLFGGFIVAAIVLAWLMLPLPLGRP
jgi:FtsH-binding integral membrane protein